MTNDWNGQRDHMLYIDCIKYFERKIYYSNANTSGAALPIPHKSVGIPVGAASKTLDFDTFVGCLHSHRVCLLYHIVYEARKVSILFQTRINFLYLFVLQSSCFVDYCNSRFFSKKKSEEITRKIRNSQNSVKSGRQFLCALLVEPQHALCISVHNGISIFS